MHARKSAGDETTQRRRNKCVDALVMELLDIPEELSNASYLMRESIECRYKRVYIHDYSLLSPLQKFCAGVLSGKETSTQTEHVLPHERAELLLKASLKLNQNLLPGADASMHPAHIFNYVLMYHIHTTSHESMIDQVTYAAKVFYEQIDLLKVDYIETISATAALMKQIPPLSPGMQTICTFFEEILQGLTEDTQLALQEAMTSSETFQRYIDNDWALTKNYIASIAHFVDGCSLPTRILTEAYRKMSEHISGRYMELGISLDIEYATHMPESMEITSCAWDNLSRRHRAMLSIGNQNGATTLIDRLSRLLKNDPANGLPTMDVTKLDVLAKFIETEVARWETHSQTPLGRTSKSNSPPINLAERTDTFSGTPFTQPINYALH